MGHFKIKQIIKQICLNTSVNLAQNRYVGEAREVPKHPFHRALGGNKTESVDKINQTKKQKIAVTINKESIVRKKNDTSEEVRSDTARSSLDCKASKIFEAVTSVKQNLLTRKNLMMLLKLNMLKLMSFLILVELHLFIILRESC